MLVASIFSFTHNVFYSPFNERCFLSHIYFVIDWQMLSIWSGSKIWWLVILNSSLTRQQILDSSKLKEFADDNFKFDKKWKKVIKTGRKHCGKRRNCSLRAISPFPTVFSEGLFPRGVKRCHCVGMG